MHVSSVVQSFAVDDVDQAIEIGNRLFYEHRVEPLHDMHAFRMQLTAGAVGAVTAGIVGYDCRVESRVGGLDDSYAVSIPTRGELHGRSGGPRSSPIRRPRRSSAPSATPHAADGRTSTRRC